MFFGKIYKISIMMTLVLIMTLSANSVRSVWTPGEPLVHCGNVKGGTAETACSMCDLAVGINNIVQFITSLVFVAAILIIVIAGVMYIVAAGNQSTTEMAKSAIKNALIGAVVVLAAFVIVHFVLKVLFVKDTGDLSGATTPSSSWQFNCN